MKRLFVLALLSSFVFAAPVAASDCKKCKESCCKQCMKEGKKSKSKGKSKSKIGPDAVPLKEGENHKNH